MKKLILSLALSAFAFSLVAADADPAKDATKEKTCPMKDKTCCPAGKDAQGGCCKDKAADKAKPADEKPADKK